MKALITGANGFVGGHLERYLNSVGDEVVSLNPEVDIADQKSLSNELEQCGGSLDAIYHLAALAHVAESFGSTMEVFRVNVLGTVNLLETARRFCPKSRVLFVSSSEVYGRVPPQQLPIDESFRLAPLSPYAASKAAAEHVAMQAFRAFEQDIIVARPFNHIGPGQSEAYVVSALAKRVLRAKLLGESSIPVGNLGSKRDFTDVRDVVRAYRKMMDVGVSGQTYNVCSGKSYSISEIAEQIIKYADADIVLERDPSLARDVEASETYGDSSKCCNELSWKPLIPISESLQSVLEWWSDRLRPG